MVIPSSNEKYYIYPLSDRPNDLTAIDKTAVSDFLTDFGSYLDEGHWRSQWGAYAGERCGPRTNNAVEKFNRFIKEQVTDNRQRRALHEFSAYLKDTAAWARLSRYGHATNKGLITVKHRRQAAALIANGLMCRVPRTWQGPDGVEYHEGELWIFVRDNKTCLPQGRTLPMHIISEGDFGRSAKRFITSDYSTFEDARQLRNTFCLVSYPRLRSS